MIKTKDIRNKVYYGPSIRISGYEVWLSYSGYSILYKNSDSFEALYRFAKLLKKIDMRMIKPDRMHYENNQFTY